MVDNGRRFFAFWLDVLIIALIPVFYMMYALTTTDPENMTNIFLSLFPFVMIWALLFALLRDITGRSLGKRAMGIRIISTKEEKVPRWKLIVRNVTTPIWPIEGIAVLVSGRRIMDRMLGLELVREKMIHEIRGPLQ